MNDCCPICKYTFDHCQCRVGGNAHPDIWCRSMVVKDHLYLLTPTQLQHVVNLEKYWETSYEIDDMNEIVEELKEAYDDSCN